MKKLRILLIIFLVSILYVPRETYALTSEYYSQNFYSETLMSSVESNQEKIDAIVEYVKQNGMNTIPYDNTKFFVFDISTINTENIRVYLVNSSSTSTFVKNYYGGSYSIYKVFQFGIGGTSLTYKYDNGTVFSNGGELNGNWIFRTSYVDNNCNPTTQNCILQLENYYYYSADLIDSVEIPFQIYNSNDTYEIPYKVGNVVYTPPTTLPLKKLIDSFGGITPIGICQNPITKVGELKRVKSLRVSINGISNALKDEMSGKLSFIYTGERLTNNDITISVTARSRNYLRYDSDVTGDYDLQCSSTENKCDIFYSYIYEDDVDAPLELIFNLDFGSSWSGDINITNCEYTGVFENYSYNYENVDDFNSDIENYLNNSTIGGVDDYLLDFFGSDNFKDKHGISSIIQTPIVFLESLNSKTCAPIQLTIPYINKNATINCMSDVYTSKFNGIYSLIVLAINSVLCYNLALSVVGYVKQAKNPDDDRIEVLDL